MQFKHMWHCIMHIVGLFCLCKHPQQCPKTATYCHGNTNVFCLQSHFSCLGLIAIHLLLLYREQRPRNCAVILWSQMKWCLWFWTDRYCQIALHNYYICACDNKMCSCQSVFMRCSLWKSCEYLVYSFTNDNEVEGLNFLYRPLKIICVSTLAREEMHTLGEG